jgi:large subunit ribosomal protein L1
MDVASAVREAKGGKIEYRTEKAGVVQARIGKASFSSDAIRDNAKALITALVRAKPASAKGQYLKSITLSSTMGPGVRIDPVAFAEKSDEEA